MKTLEQRLWEYGQKGRYPFHMPGHKRNLMDAENEITDWFNEIHRLDITEITDFDNLHRPEGIIRQLEDEMRAFYHTKKTYPLVGGSTAGILSAVSACTEIGDEILIARNCHKSVLNACVVSNLRPHYIYPEWIPECGIYGGISPDKVDKCLKQNKNIRAVLIVSPTYEGIVLDIHKISEVVHSYNIPLIVDEAHGAHFSYRSGDSAFPASAIDFADMVIQSLHKTLPCMTQTALLHVNGERIDLCKLERYLGIYQSSSPSYVMMADISHCFHYMAEHPECMRMYEEKLQKLRKVLEKLHFVRILGKKDIGNYGIFDYDIGKLVFVPCVEGISGRNLFEKLRDTYQLELEMCAVSYCIGMTAPLDIQEGYDRLVNALLALEASYEGAGSADGHYEECSVPETVLNPYEAERADFERVSYAQAEGRISARTLYVYPPGVAFLAAGERIDRAVLNQIEVYENNQFDITGISEAGMLTVVR